MNNLKKLRIERGYKQLELCNYLHVDQGTYSRYESGYRKLDPDTLIKLSKFFNISIDYLLGNIDEPLSLDDLQFMKELKHKSDKQLMDENRFVDEEGKLISKEDIKKMLEILRADWFMTSFFS